MLSLSDHLTWVKYPSYSPTLLYARVRKMIGPFETTVFTTKLEMMTMNTDMIARQ